MFIAAIARPALGGGAEWPLESTLRVIDREKGGMGQPESGLGLIAGAGGVVFLPRLVGVIPGLTILLSGGTVSAVAAKHLGWVDELANEGEVYERSAEIAKTFLARNKQANAQDWLRREFPHAKANKTWEELREEVAGPVGEPSVALQLVKELYTKIKPLVSEVLAKSETERIEAVRQVFSNSAKEALLKWAEKATSEPQKFAYHQMLRDLIEVSFSVALPREATKQNKETKAIETVLMTRPQTLEATFRTVIESLENPDTEAALTNVMKVFGDELAVTGEGADGINYFADGFRIPSVGDEILKNNIVPRHITNEISKESGPRFWLSQAQLASGTEQKSALKALAKFGARRAAQLSKWLGPIPSADSSEFLTAFVVHSQPDFEGKKRPYIVKVDGGVKVQIVDEKILNKKVRLELVSPLTSKGANAAQLKQQGQSFRYVAFRVGDIDVAAAEIKSARPDVLVLGEPIANLDEGYHIQFLQLPHEDALFAVYAYEESKRSELRTSGRRNELQETQLPTKERILKEIPRLVSSSIPGDRDAAVQMLASRLKLSPEIVSNYFDNHPDVDAAWQAAREQATRSELRAQFDKLDGSLGRSKPARQTIREIMNAIDKRERAKSVSLAGIPIVSQSEAALDANSNQSEEVEIITPDLATDPQVLVAARDIIKTAGGRRVYFVLPGTARSDQDYNILYERIKDLDAFKTGRVAIFNEQNLEEMEHRLVRLAEDGKLRRIHGFGLKDRAGEIYLNRLIDLLKQTLKKQYRDDLVEKNLFDKPIEFFDLRGLTMKLTEREAARLMAAFAA